jgi:PPK2 family polyphosphate:nucleotide phosphotransferase
MMFAGPNSPYRVPFDGSFDLAAARTNPASDDQDDIRKKRGRARRELNKLQRLLSAGDKHAVLLVFQAMDAAGKDSTIRAVMRGVDPSGCQVHTFRKPSTLELDHDFLWRSACRLPERGQIGIFNRSYYEEVLVVRVHPEMLQSQRLPELISPDNIWQDRYQSIRDHEAHLARNGTAILKFWLNVSKAEQRRRLLARLDNPDKNWKFEVGDIAERRHWDDYMHAYEQALNATSRPWAPWYAIPADDKSYMQARVGHIIVNALTGIGLAYPELSGEDRAIFEAARQELG